MPILNIHQRKIARRRRDGQIASSSTGSLPSSNTSAQSNLFNLEDVLSHAESRTVELVNEKFDSLTIDDSNIISGSGFSENDGYWYWRTYGEYNSNNESRSINVSEGNNRGILAKTFYLNSKYVGKDLTFSIEVSTPTNVDVWLVARSFDENNKKIHHVSDVFNIQENEGVKLLSYTFKPISSKIRLDVYNRSKGNELFVYKGFVLTEGVKGTYWKKSEKDQQKEINSIKANYQEKTLNNTDFYPEITSLNAVFVLKCLGVGFSNLYLPNNAKLGTIIQVISHNESTQELRVRAKTGDTYYNGNTVPTYTAVGTGQCLSVLRISNGWQKLNYL